MLMGLLDSRLHKFAGQSFVSQLRQCDLPCDRPFCPNSLTHNRYDPAPLWLEPNDPEKIGRRWGCHSFAHSRVFMARLRSSCN